MMTLLCAFALGAWLSPLHADTGPQKRAARAGGTIIWDKKINDASQLNGNSSMIEQGSAYGNLIDGNTETILHSAWNIAMADPNTTVEAWLDSLQMMVESSFVEGPPDAGYHFLQVDLLDKVSQFKFEYKGRNSAWHDNPNDIEIFATNNEALFNNPVNSNQDQWTRIEELTPHNTKFPQNVTVIDEPWQSPVIDMTGNGEGAFRYLRFVIKGTTNMNKGMAVNRIFVVPDITGVTYNLSEFQVYSTREVEPAEELHILLDSIQSLWSEYKIEFGDDPGYMDSVRYAATYKLWEEANDAIYLDLSNEEYTDYVTRLRAAVDTFMTEGIRPVETGYYNFVSGDPRFMNSQGVTKSMCIDVDKNFAWATSDSLDAMQLWYVERLPEGNWSIQNVVSGEYVYTVDGSSARVPMTGTHQCDQVFELFKQYPGRFKIYNVKNNTPYHAESHNNGLGVTGRIVTYNDGGESPSSWYVRKVTDQKLLDSLKTASSKSLLEAAMKLALDSAEASRAKAEQYAPLLSRANQFSVNSSESRTPRLEELVDGNIDSWFNSFWNVAMKSPTINRESWLSTLAANLEGFNTDPGWHFLQVALDEPVSRFRFEYKGRNSDTWHDNPNDIEIFATNDEVLYNNKTNADSTKWVRIDRLTPDNTDFPRNVLLVEKPWQSPVIDMTDKGGPYKYIRFVVRGTTNMNVIDTRMFTAPEITGVTYDISEFQMYKAEPDETSEYYTVNGMKEVCDALDKAIEDARQKLADGTLTQTDIEALQQAYRLVDSAYVDRDALYGEMQSLLKSGQSLYKDTKYDRKITSGSQFNSNSYENTGQAGSLANLIDGDRTTMYHTLWSDSMASPSLTKEQWTQMINETFVNCIGTGYHNLNVDLKDPVSSFFFELHSRNDEHWHDTPSDVEIYATNEVTLFEDPNDANTPQWTRITELSEGFPTEMTTDKPYTSPTIELNGEYRYIRFVVKNTVTANNNNGDVVVGHTRDFAHPEFTGITWNLSEFQIYTEESENVQYNYNPEAQAAADRLSAALEKYGAYSKADINSKDAIDELRDAVEGLRDARVDTSEVVRLYNSYKSLAESALNGDAGGDVVGSIDSYEAADDFDALLDEARAGIDPKKPTKAEVSGALDKINRGYEEFMSHVTLPEPYVWYVIRSASTADADAERRYAVDQPAYLKGFSTGDVISIDSLDYSSKLSDISAVWRLVPAGDTVKVTADGDTVPCKPWERKYAIQSLATGQYWGPYVGVSNAIVMSHVRTPYSLIFNGSNSFKLLQEGADPSACAEPSSRANCGVYNNNWNADWDKGNLQGWKFEETELHTETFAWNSFPANTTRIVTLPWALTGANAISENNPGVVTYAVNSVDTVPDGGYALSLTEEDEFEAGEPFIIVTPESDDESGLYPLMFSLPPTEADALADTSAVVANGLVGTLQGCSIQGMASLYFESSALNVCGDYAVSIPGLEGYIDARLVENQGGNRDKVIGVNGEINHIEEAAAAADGGAVDVYTVDGVLLRRGVRASEAAEGLGKGVYIIGKKKILVR